MNGVTRINRIYVNSNLLAAAAWKGINNDSESQSVQTPWECLQVDIDSCHCHWGWGVGWGNGSECRLTQLSCPALVTSLAVFRKQNLLKLGTPPWPSEPMEDLASFLTEKTGAKTAELPQAPTPWSCHPPHLPGYLHLCPYTLPSFLLLLISCSRKGHLFPCAIDFILSSHTKTLVQQSSSLPWFITFLLSTGWIFSIPK